MKRWLFSVSSLILLLTLLLGAAVLCQAPPLVAVERHMLQLRSGWVPVPEVSPVVAVRLGDEVASRDALAALVERLADERARAILLYLPFAEPSPADARTRLEAMRDAWRRDPGAGHNALWRRIDRELREFQGELDGDARLAEALRLAGNVVLAAPVVTGNEPDETLVELKKLSLKLDVPGWSWEEHLRHFSNPVVPRWRPEEISSVALPWGELQRQAAAVGFIPMASEPLPPGLLLLPSQERYFPSAPLAALMVGDRSSFRTLKFALRGPSSALLAGKRSYPVDHWLRLLPLPEAMLAPLPVISMDQLLGKDPSVPALDGKVVIVGRFTSPGEADYADAYLLSQMFGDFQLARPGWLPLVELLGLGYFAFFLWLVVPRLPQRTALVLMGLFVLVWVAAASLLLVNFGWWLQLTPPLILTILGLGLLTLERGLRQRRESLVELNCRLGELLQEKGLLDRAMVAYQACPPGHEQAREHLYSLGLDFERKRRFGQALAVYEHLVKGGRYKDVAERLNRLRAHDGSAPLGKTSRDSTVVLDKGAVHPTLGRYEIVRELGQGAMGTVYLGRDPKINREVAIKTLAYGSVDDTQLPMIKERFFREAEAAGRLNHPGIVTIFDAGEEHDLAYLAMEFLSGVDLVRYCKPESLLSPAEVLRVVADVAEALAYAHDNEVVHRDIKPANIMLLDDGSVKVTDFGIARVVSNSQTQTGMVLGTPSYMSPEQVAAKKVDGRSDLFSLGSVCYELLCGDKAFVGDSMASLMYNISNVNYTPLREKKRGLPKCCYALVDSLLVKAVSRRPKDASEVAAVARACREKARK